MDPISFNNNLFKFYNSQKRNLKWREVINPYYILISEFMLQQTQVNRVIKYFDIFITSLPTLKSLAEAPQEIVLSLWLGLGYNRRAIYLHTVAKELIKKYNGIIPQDPKYLMAFKGIGDYTAKAIITYSYNIPLIFVETNIRSVFFIYYKDHFTDKKKIDDNSIKYLIEERIDQINPRDWYYALMDLGTQLKKEYKDKHIQKSKSFSKQSKFQGSTRQIRGQIIKIILEKKRIYYEELLANYHNKNIIPCIEKLIKENFIYVENNIIYIK